MSLCQHFGVPPPVTNAETEFTRAFTRFPCSASTRLRVSRCRPTARPATGRGTGEEHGEQCNRVSSRPTRAPHTLVERTGFADWMSRHGALRRRDGLRRSGLRQDLRTAGAAHARARNGGAIVWLTLDSSLVHRATFWMMALHRIRDAGLPVDEQLTVALERVDNGGAHSLPALLTRTVRADSAVGHPDRRQQRRYLRERGAGRPRPPRTARLLRTDHLHDAVRHPGTTEIESRMPTTLAVSPPALLLLTPAEIAAIAEATQADVSDDEITRIAEETGGWALGVLTELGYRSARSREHSAGAAIADGLSRAPGYGGLRALSVTSIDDELRSGRHSLSTRALSSAAEKNSASAGGTTALPEASGCCLRSDARLEEVLVESPDEAARAHLVLAKLHQDRGENSAAFAAAIAAADWPLTARLYRRGITRATMRRASSTAVIRRVPSEALRAQPVLMFAAALDDFASGRVYMGDQAPDGPAARDAEEAACDTPLVHDRRCMGPGDHRPRPAAARPLRHVGAAAIRRVQHRAGAHR